MFSLLCATVLWHWYLFSTTRGRHLEHGVQKSHAGPPTTRRQHRDELWGGALRIQGSQTSHYVHLVFSFYYHNVIEIIRGRVCVRGVCGCVCVCVWGGGGVSFLFSPFPLSTTHSQVPSLTTHSPRQKEILYPGLRQDLFCLTCSPKKGSSLFWAREGGGGQSGKNCAKPEMEKNLQPYFEEVLGPLPSTDLFVQGSSFWKLLQGALKSATPA